MEGMTITSKRVCILGAGAIGGLLGVRLAVAGHRVTFVARGPHLAAMKDHGFSLTMHDGTSYNTHGLDCIYTSDVKSVSEQNVVVVGLKGHQIETILADINASTMIGDKTVVMTTQNGIPWWFFQECYNHSKLESFANTVVRSVDSHGALFKGIDPTRVIGCVSYPAAKVASPGHVEHIENIRFPVGELNGDVSTQRVKDLSDMLINAGFKSPILPDIRSEIWLKLYGSVAFNPISALTHATLREMCEFPTGRELINHVMSEMEAVGDILGLTLRVSREKRINGASSVGHHKTSMLTDVENGKPMEIDGLLGSVVELAGLTDISIPYTRSLFNLASLLGHVMESNKVKFPPSSTTI
eukprot:CFRG5029T1